MLSQGPDDHPALFHCETGEEEAHAADRTQKRYGPMFKTATAALKENPGELNVNTLEK